MTVLIIWEYIDSDSSRLQIYKENIVDRNVEDDLRAAHRGVLGEDENLYVSKALKRVKNFLETKTSVYDTDDAKKLDPLEFNQFNYPKLVVHCCEIL